MTPALKAAIAHYAGDPAWLTLRPSLVDLNAGEIAFLTEKLEAAGYVMSGLRATADA